MMRLHLALGLLLACLLCCSAAEGRDVRVKLNHAFDAPPVSVELIVPQAELLVKPWEDPGSASVSPIGAALGGMLHDRRIRNQEPALDRLRAALQPLQLDRLAAERFRTELDAFDFIQDSPIVVFSGADAAERELPTDVLRLTLEYYLTFDFSILRVRLSADLDRPDAKKRRKREKDYHQRIWYEIGAPRMRIGDRDDKYMAYWLGLGDEAFRTLMRDAIDALVKDLAYDLPRSVALGMRKGHKQHSFVDPPVSNYGVVIRTEDGREWLRIRNGYLVNREAR